MTLGDIKFSFQVHSHEYKVKPGIKSVIFPGCIHLYRHLHRIGADVAKMVLSVKAIRTGPLQMSHRGMPMQFSQHRVKGRYQKDEA